YLACTGGVAKTDSYLLSNPSWTYPLDPTGSGMAATAVHLPDPANPETVLAAAFNAVYRSTDGGTNWTRIDVSAMLGMRGNVTDFFGTDEIFAAYGTADDDTGGVMVSNDEGVTWTDLALPNTPFVNRLYAADSGLYAAVGTENDSSASRRGIYRYVDNAWTQLSGPFNGKKINDITSNGTFLFAAAGDVQSGGVYRSSDGTTWEDISEAFDETRCMKSLAVDPNNAGSVFVAFGCPAGTAVIYKSENSGSTWSTHYTALKDEVPTTMLVDDLIAGLNTGAYEFNEDSNDRADSPVYVPWNGYLSMINVLELVNTSDQNTNVNVTLLNSIGEQQSQQSYSLAARSQFDVIINDLTGFASDALGIVKVEYSSSAVDGRVFFYRTTNGGSGYEFAFSVPFTNALSGTSYVSFNTYQPSTNPAEASDTVLNWLSLINLDSVTRSFTVTRYSLSGETLQAVAVEVPALARVDIDGGHGAGPNTVGYLEIEPTVGSAPYKAILTRYGVTASQNYSFAFPLLAQAANADIYVGVSTGAGAQNWLELQNIAADPTEVTLQTYSNQGELLQSQELTLPARQGRHLEIGALVPNGNSGYVRIMSASSALLAQSMFYVRDAAGSISAMYGSQASASRGGTRWGSYNLYLNMFNWLRVANTANESKTITLTVYPPGSAVQEFSFELGAHQGRDLGLHESGYGTAPDSYGVFSVSGESILTELIRIRPDAAGFDFFAPTAVRR
ncbi:MAG: exo-alpha-sialidase, partial [Bdellovibrionales bacterium]|nr:exo-alpha-sialidase [Bdellovibrionales bacterium]